MADVKLALTDAGLALMAKIAAGDGKVPLEITRVATSSEASPNPLTLNALSKEEQEFVITDRVITGARTTLSLYLNNYGNALTGQPPVVQGYPLTQIGFYANDPDEGEILMRISQFDNPNYVPAATERAWEYSPGFNFVTGNASTVIVNINPSGTATIGQLKAHINSVVASEAGVHGLRYWDDTLQVFNAEEGEWDTIGTGSGTGSVKGYSIENGVLSNTMPFGVITPNDDGGSTLEFNSGFASVSGSTINLS